MIRVMEPPVSSSSEIFTKTTLLIVVLLAVLLAFVFLQKQQANIQQPVSQNQQEEHTTGLKPPTVYQGEDFRITIPEGWSIQNRMPGTILTLGNPQENISTNSAAKKINFKSFISVSEGSIQERNIDEIVEFVKKTEIETALNPRVTEVLSDEFPIEQRLFGATFTHQDVNIHAQFAVYVAQDKYFLISGKTIDYMWPSYKDTFYQVIESFKLTQ